MTNPLNWQALQFQTPDRTVGVKRDGTTYTLRRADGQGYIWEIDLKSISTNGLAVHVLDAARITDGTTPTTIDAGGSAYEYAIEATPDGGTLTFIGSGAHGYDEQTGLTITVDGSTVSPEDGATVEGAEVIATRTSELTHPDAAGKVADVTVTYTMTHLGLDVDWSITWQQALTAGRVYTAMLPVAEALSRGKTFGGSVVNLTTDDDSAKSNSTGPSACLWTPAGNIAAALHLHDDPWSWSYSDTRQLWLQDRAGGARNKVYAESNAVPITAGATWRSSFRLLAGYFDGGANTTLNR